MILRTSPTSPFGRKVKILAKLLGIYDEIEIGPIDMTSPDDTLTEQNPLGKIPILILDDGTCLYDSRVICEYLNDTYEGSFLPQGQDKFEALTLSALADGINDAAISQVLEKRFNDERTRSEKWLTYQAAKIERALTLLEAAPPAFEGKVNIGHIALATALSFLDLRFEGLWRKSYPNLVDWLDRFDKHVPAYDETSVENSS